MLARLVYLLPAFKQEIRAIDTNTPSPEPGLDPTPGSEFAMLGLSPAIVDALLKVGYSTPTEIQRLAIPPALAGRDVLGTAHTGTGKTAAYSLPIVQRLAAGEHLDQPRGLIITPTRELAQQVGTSVHRYGATSSVEALVVHGGTSVAGEAVELRFGCDVLVATPGRLLDHLGRGSINLSEIECLVLDEADRMLDMGFIDDVKEIVAATPDSRQTFLFSATMPDSVLYLARQMMKDPVRVKVGLEAAAEGIRQVLKPVNWSQKHTLLLHILEERASGQVLVFTRTRDTAGYLAAYLSSRGISADDLHGAKSQKERDRSLERFREAKTRVLVATNVAARGLDIRGIRHVINFDVPEDPRDYVHRVGRTARGDETGDAVTLVSRSDWLLVREIEALTGETIERRQIPGFEPSEPPPEPKSAPRGGRDSDSEADRPRRSGLGIRRR